MKIRNILVIGIVVLLLVSMQFFVLGQEEVLPQKEFVDFCKIKGSPISCGDGELSLFCSGCDRVPDKGVDKGVIFCTDECELKIKIKDGKEIILKGKGFKVFPPFNKIVVTEKNAEFKIDNVEFKNINPAKKNSIILDQKTGLINKVDLTTNGNNAFFDINGNELEVPANSRFKYSKNRYSEKTVYTYNKKYVRGPGFELPNGTNIINLESAEGITILTEGRVTLPNGVSLNDKTIKEQCVSPCLAKFGETFINEEGDLVEYGKAFITEDGSLIENGQATTVNGEVYNVTGKTGSLLIAPDLDLEFLGEYPLTNYPGSWVQRQGNNLLAQSWGGEKGGNIDVSFMRGGALVAYKIINGDGSIIDEGDHEEDLLLVYHFGSPDGSMEIKTGLLSLTLSENAVNFRSLRGAGMAVSMKIKSEPRVLEGGTIFSKGAAGFEQLSSSFETTPAGNVIGRFPDGTTGLIYDPRLKDLYIKLHTIKE